MGRLALRVAERREVANSVVEGSRRAISDARHECVAQHVQWHDEQSARRRWSKMDTARRRARTRSMLAATTSGRAKELVKQGLSDRNGMIAFGWMRERFGKTAGVAKLSDVFQFPVDIT